MLARGLIDKAVATAVAAGAAFSAVVALGAAVFFALALVLQPLAAAALTFVLFALVALAVTLVFVKRTSSDDDDDGTLADGLAGRAFVLFRNRPILATVATLAGGFIFLRNPALATMVAAAFTEKSRRRR